MLKNNFHENHEEPFSKAEKSGVDSVIKTESEIETNAMVATQKASEIWNTANKVFTDNPYIKKKCINPIGIKQQYNKLIIPLFEDFGDHEDNPVSIQFISSDGKKKFLKEAQTIGNSFTIGNLTDTDIIYVVEGYATGVTVFEATETPVVITFSSSNLNPVCKKLKHRFPKIQIIIASDNDIETETSTGSNSGKESAIQASNELGVKYVLCPVNSDFNDLFNSYSNVEDGYKEVRKSLINPKTNCIYTNIINELNSQYAVTWMGSKCLVLKECLNSDSNTIDIDFPSEADLKRYYANRIFADPTNPKREISMVEYWLKSPDRRQYRGVTFKPGKEVPEYYNLWTGFSVKPVKGDWSLFKDHILNIIVNGDIEQFLWLVSWMARIIQDPGGKKPGTSIVLRGGKGTGKSFFVDYFGQLFGNHYIQLAQQAHLLGRFNYHLKNKILIFADEGFWAGDKNLEGPIKHLITEPSLIIEQKGKDAIIIDNYTNLMIASNNNWVVPASYDERRFYVTDVSEEHKQDKPYFRAIHEQMINGGYEAMMYDLSHWEYSIDELREAPKTNALLDQIKNSMSYVEKFWFEKLEEGILCEEHVEWTGEIEFKRLHVDYCKFADNLKARHIESIQGFGKEIRKFCPDIKSIKKNQGGKRINISRFPLLEECRKQFETLSGMEGKIDWDEVL